MKAKERQTDNAAMRKRSPQNKISVNDVMHSGSWLLTFQFETQPYRCFFFSFFFHCSKDDFFNILLFYFILLCLLDLHHQ